MALGLLCWAYLFYQGIVGCPKYIEANPTHKAPGLNCTIKTLTNFIALLLAPSLSGAVGWFFSSSKVLRGLYLLTVLLPLIGIVAWYNYVGMMPCC